MFKKGKQIGSFVILESLSDNGGMAELYKARIVDDTLPYRHGNFVALKVTRSTELHSHIYEQLLVKETDLLHDLRHPGIVRLIPIDQFNKRQFFARISNEPDAPWYFCMELLNGGTLANWIGSRKLSREWRIEVFYQIAVVLDYLHLRGISHRDLKPENIMFRNEIRPQTIPQPIFIDFGLSEKSMIRTTINAATLSHASPEQLHQIMGTSPPTENIDHLASDIWSLGIIAYELFAEIHPFYLKREHSRFGFRTTSTSLEDLKKNFVQTVTYDDPESLASLLPPRLDTLILAMLNKTPAQRPTIHEVINRLETDIEFIAPRLPAD